MSTSSPAPQRREYNPSSREKAFMVRAMHLERRKARDAGTEAALDTRLTEVRHVISDVFSCRIERVNAFTAWLRIRESRDAATAIKSNEAKFIRAYMSLGTNDAERSQLVDELSEIMGCPPQVIMAICVDTRTRCEQLLGTTNAGAVDPAVMDHINLAGPIKFLGGGEHTDYDTEIKGQWRAHLHDFLEAQVPKEHRSQMKILCLPGKECLEIPMYLELGFSPENIHGFEGGDRIARAEYVLNAQKYGIKPVLGLLEDTLPRSRERYDVVSLDFTGPICQTYCEIAESILLKERAFVMVNTLQKREPTGTQQRLAAVHAAMQMQQRRRLSFERRHAEVFGGAEPSDEEFARPDDAFSLANWRGRVSHLIGIMGSDRPENWQVLASKVRQLPLLDGLESAPFESDGDRYRENLSLLLQPVISAVMVTLERNGFFKVSDLNEAWKIAHLSNMVTSAVFGKTFVQHLEKRAYRTKVGEKETEFHTDMAVLRSPRSLYKEVAPTVEFLINSLLQSIDIEGDINAVNADRIGAGVIRGRAGEFVALGQGKKSDRIATVYGDQRLASVHVHEILSAATQHYAFLLSCPKDDWAEQMKIERTMIGG